MAFWEGIAGAEPRVLMYSMDEDYHIYSLLTTKVDGLIKSPSAPLGAGLRFNFLVAAPKGPYSSVFACLVPPVAGEPFMKPSFRRFSTRSSGLILALLPLNFRFWEEISDRVRGWRRDSRKHRPGTPLSSASPKGFPQREAEGLWPRPSNGKTSALWFREARRCPRAPAGAPKYRIFLSFSKSEGKQEVPGGKWLGFRVLLLSEPSALLKESKY